MIFKRAHLTEPRQFAVASVEATPGEGQMLIRVASCGLCNWELNHWKGIIVPKNGYPLSLGHEYAGTVVEIGSGVTKFKIGDQVAVLGNMVGFAEYCVCNESRAIKLEDSIDPKYVLGEPLKCIVTVLDAAAPKPGDYGVVLGCGPMGQWCIQALAGNLLAGLIAIDIDDAKLDMAKQFGATAVINSKRENVMERLKALTNGHLADFVIEGTGLPALFNEAQNYLRNTGRGRLILMSAHETVTKDFDFRVLIEKGADVFAPHPSHSLDQMDDFRRAIALVNNGTFCVKELVSHEFKLSQIQQAFETLEHKPAGYIKGIVCPD